MGGNFLKWQGFGREFSGKSKKRVSYNMGMEIEVGIEREKGEERKGKETPISVGNGTLQGKGKKTKFINAMNIHNPQKTPYNKKGEGESKVNLQWGRGERSNLSAWGTDEEALPPRQQHLERALSPARVCETAGRATLDSLPFNFTKISKEVPNENYSH